jgi:hypothetical protein
MRNIVPLSALLSLLLALVVACSGGSSPSEGGGTGPNSNPEDDFRLFVSAVAADIPTGPAPSDVYDAAVEIQTAIGTYGVELNRALEILNEEIEDPELYNLLLLVLVDGYSLTALMDHMTGVIVDEENGVVAGLSLDQNLDPDDQVQMYGDPQWVQGIDGSGMQFDAPGEYLLLPDSDALDLDGESASIEVWIHPYTNLIAAGIVHKGTEPDYSDESFSLQYNQAGQIALILTNMAGKHTYIISNEPRLPVNTWHHLVAAWDRTNVWLYVNGAEVLSKLYYQNGWKSSLPADFAPIFKSDGDVMIGSQVPFEPADRYRFDGIIDNVFLYNRLLTPDVVFARYQELQPGS